MTLRKVTSRGSRCSLLGMLSLLLALTLGIAPALAATDTEAPGYVDNVTAIAGDGEVELAWNAATDDTGVTGYKIYYGTASVFEAGQSYNLGFVEVGNVLTSTVTGLENDMTHYFAVTALDATGNESLEYSIEVSATPMASEDDGNPPSVVSAKATNCTKVEITFSESVALPTANATEAFEIENFDTLQFVTVTDVAYGDTSAVVVLTTETLEESAQYLLTVGTEVEDVYGHAMVSGTSDTGSFKGVPCTSTDVDSGTDTTDTSAPVLEEVTPQSLTQIVLAFDEDVVLPDFIEATEENPALSYMAVYDASNIALEVIDVTYDEDADGAVEKSRLVLTTAEQTPDVDYFVLVTGLQDALGNTTDGGVSASGTYTSVSPEPAVDTVAPEDVTQLISEVTDLLVNLNWASSVDSAGDLVDQILYVSKDGGATYEKVGSLGDGTAYSYEGGVEGETYMFKVTTLDDAGNESAGALITAVLPTTGPGLAALAAASLLGGGLLGRRKK